MSTIQNTSHPLADTNGFHNIERELRDYMTRVKGNCDLLKLDVDAHPELTACFDRIPKGIMAVFQETQKTFTNSGYSTAKDNAEQNKAIETSLKDVQQTIHDVQGLVKAIPELHVEDDLLELEFAVYQFSKAIHESLAQNKRDVETANGSESIAFSVQEKGKACPTILVADDDDSNRNLLGRLLQPEKYQLKYACNGQEVLEMLSAGNIDLLLLDLVMPGASGFEVLRTIRGAEETRDIPIVMISGVDETAKVVACLEAGADDYVLKPFNAVLLRARVRVLLDRKQARDLERVKTEELRVAVLQLDNERKAAEQMLLNILPRSTSEELRINGKVSPTYFEDVTIIFTDFVSFTASTEKLTTDELVSTLNDYFTAFDSIVDRYGLEKLKTVGDSYIFLSGLPERTPSHPVDAVLASMEMLQYVETRQQANITPAWSMRIGIHTGSVVAGVVGTRKFAFDVWGDAVNFASRMVSSGGTNRINFSERAFQRCKDFFLCSHRGFVEIKGNRKAEMYFVDAVIPALLEHGGTDCPAAFKERYSRYFHREPRAFPPGLRAPCSETGAAGRAQTAPGL